MSPAALHIGLVHYPVLGRRGEVIATSTVNHDLHDLARAGKTYGVQSYYVITPLRTQALLVERLTEHWTRGSGARYNPNRKEALEFLRIQPSIEAAIEELTVHSGGRRPFVLATSARRHGTTLGYEAARRSLEQSDRPYLILFGTGWGLAPEALRLTDGLLAPVLGVGSYNHLSVRSAASIILDRLRGQHDETDSPAPDVAPLPAAGR